MVASVTAGEKQNHGQDVTIQRESDVFDTPTSSCGGVLKQKAETPPACWSVSFDRNPRFVRRSALLAELEAKLAPTGRFRKAAVAGLGKTQIALEMAYRTWDLFADSSVIWVPALSRETVS
jgi:hypothetical protein